MYNFFRVLPIVNKHLGSRNVRKKLLHTKWYEQADVINFLHEGYKQIIDDLMSIAGDIKQSRETRHEAALSLCRKMRNTEYRPNFKALY